MNVILSFVAALLVLVSAWAPITLVRPPTFMPTLYLDRDVPGGLFEHWDKEYITCLTYHPQWGHLMAHGMYWHNRSTSEGQLPAWAQRAIMHTEQAAQDIETIHIVASGWPMKCVAMYSVSTMDQSGAVTYATTGSIRLPSSWNPVLSRYGLGFPALVIVKGAVVNWACAMGLVFLVTMTARMMGRWRRVRRGQCPECGYDVTSSRERCPECGRPVDTVQRR